MWLQIPGTEIDYPVVYGEEPLYWLEHAFDGTPQKAGTLFMEGGAVPLISLIRSFTAIIRKMVRCSAS